MKFKRPHIFVLALILAGLSGGFLSGELCLSLFWHEPNENLDQIEYKYIDIYDKFFKLEQDVYKSQRKMSKSGFFASRKGVGTKRVFIIGESIGYNIDENRFKRRCERVLPNCSFEIINCSMGGYDSFRVALVGREILDYQPDLVVILSGNNDFIGISRINPFRYKGLLSHVRLYRLITDIFYPTYKLGKEGSNKYFNDNLRAFIHEAKRRNVPVVICTIPVNYKDFPPVINSPSFSNREYFYARHYLEQKEHGKAVKYLQELLSKEPGNPSYHYYMGKELDYQKRYDNAKEEFTAVLDMDLWNRCTPTRNNIIRQMTIENKVNLADVEKRLIDFVPYGLMGFNVFCDWCHVYGPVYDVFYAEILDSIYRDNPHIFADKSRWNIAANTLPSYEEMLVPINIEKKNNANQMLFRAISFIMNNSFAEFCDQACAFLQDAYLVNPGFVAGISGFKGNCIEAFAASEWIKISAPSINVFWDKVLLHTGEALRRAHREEIAIKYFDEVIAGNPACLEAYLFRGLARLSEAKIDEAKNDFDKVISLDPNYSWLKEFPER